MSNEEILREAILHKKRVSATFGGHHRLMCPHALGTTKKGERNVMSYQYGGDTNLGQVTTQGKENWRCMTIDKLTDLRIIEGEWRTFGNYKEANKCLAVMELEVGKK